MPKLSATLLLCASLYAATDAEVVSFLKKGIGGNPSISNLQVDINGKQNVSGMNGWQAYFVSIEADLKQGGDNRHINQNGTYFVSGDVIAPELVNLKTGERYNDIMAPGFNNAFYTKANLISGNANAEHKVAVFSDPLCPFCRRFAPEALAYMAKYPKTFAVYYYHFPLAQLHPASVSLCKAAIAAEQNGIDDVTLKMYQVDVNANEKDDQKILDAFNKTFKTKLTLVDLKRPSVLKQFELDQKTVTTMMVNGTPTVFFDGQKDPKKTKYKDVKVQ
ncbi:MAG: thioredoxin domain-containing protein [Sulfuricurvum sp.]|uniref:DsbA family protein n=1 Tax=Sulfuricurvum sp. TaxID=2025608 RepID=UPI002637C3CA|nr:thioredoxin domain-containing protein [Sulfuricurvum sp.]MDD2828819.1 thioredoxin domain-containing protein [Sulfuricurvum sp.]MDD4948722.1 thioredoxin domain-containing protein [Sulfuricurvum sp.]